MNFNLDKSTEIFQFLKYQKIFYNKNLLDTLEIYSNNKNKFKELSIDNKKLISEDIKKLINLFEKVCIIHDINYLNYILILESLSNKKIKNFCRFFSYRWYKLLNSSILKEQKQKLKFKYEYSEINKSSNPKKLLIGNLIHLSDKIKIISIYFLGCLNEFII
tara:strand:+ start:1726 stop:2211 length:486 start_codon:yes stop_codon:yes gene_type:complete